MQIKKDPKARLGYHQKYFENINGLHIANVCGSNGRKAVPLAVLGADVTVFDISEENKRYAQELARCADVSINFELCDFYDVDLTRFGNLFDLAYLEGGILHYFQDISRLFTLLYNIIRPGGSLILSDFHPLSVFPEKTPLLQAVITLIVRYIMVTWRTKIIFLKMSRRIFQIVLYGFIL